MKENVDWRELQGLNVRHGAHMGKWERQVWDIYCVQLKNPPDALYYDISLGTAEQQWKDLRDGSKFSRDPWASWRADVLMVYSDELVMVEVKHRANVGTLGQLMAYPMLFKASHELTLPLRPLLVARWIPLPLTMVLAELGIDYVQVRFPEDYVDHRHQGQTGLLEGGGE